MVFTGDGDLVSIGGNHFIHAARRNVDITVICVNNFIYGMTGGQLGPTTPLTARTTTSRLGNVERPFNILNLAVASGAVYVARWTTAQFNRLERAITEALLKKGFSLVEAISPCPTYYGRMNKQATGLEQMKYFRDNSIIRSEIHLKYSDIGLDRPIAVGRYIGTERDHFSI